MIQRERNRVLPSKHGRKFLADVFWQEDGTRKPVVIFSHGFKGFKDWGCFDLVAEEFARAGFVFVKFNYSHNGTTVEQPMDFADLEAFGNDNFTKCLDDLETVIDWTQSREFVVREEELQREEVCLIGHSRGGGISILKAREDARVKKLVTWASVNEFGKFWTEAEMAQIKRDGVIWIANARTKQQMPIYAQLYDDYFANKERFFIPDAVRELSIPFLIVHGTNDEAVSHERAVEMHAWNVHTELLLIENANHVFGAGHPYIEERLPEDFARVMRETIRFLS